MKPEQQLKLLTLNCVDLFTREQLLDKLDEGRPLRIKYGADPSAPDLHLGHSIPLRKLKQFQDLGHQVIFIIGDFTGRIGDPSGRTKTRPMLTDEEIQANAETYVEQVGQILDTDRCEIVYNSSWFSDMTATELLNLASQYSVARMLERDDFALRLKNEVSITVLELLYPLIQAYDSVAVKADVELGGTDQLFNFLVGRD
ncbi:MAG: tyrosine--tRNA ligase, partial [Armatimonadetes bacterium]|nr:tyrosine--tRNA ligase [Armatimonadota bacterium]